MSRPMPCPTYSRTTANPAPSTTCCTAWPMSPSRAPSRISLIPASRDSSVTRTSFSASADGGSPTNTVSALSEWNPSQIAPKSSDSTSPSARTRCGDGIPCTTSSLSDAQIEAGNPRYPRNDGVAPWERMYSSATASRSAVVRPGATAATTRSMVPAVIRPDRRIFAISSSVLRKITALPFFQQVGDRVEGALGDLVLGPLGVHLAEQPALPEVELQRLGVVVVDLEPVAHGLLGVVVPQVQLPPARVADVLDPGGVELHVVRALAPRAGPPAGEALHGDLVRDHELQHGSERPVPLGQGVLEGLRLGQRP